MDLHLLHQLSIPETQGYIWDSVEHLKSPDQLKMLCHLVRLLFDKAGSTVHLVIFLKLQAKNSTNRDVLKCRLRHILWHRLSIH
jgi:hypothetical protein